MSRNRKPRLAVVKEKARKTKRKKKTLLIIFVILFIACSCIIAFKIYQNIKNKRDNDKVKDIIESNVATPTVEEEPAEPERITNLKELQKINQEIVALLTIEGTNINYPVLHCNNNDYYINHNYKKEYSKDGALFLDKDYDFSIPSSNLLIYGHNNIGSNEMFAGLEKYKNKDYYNEHKIIKFTTVDEDAEYEIISVFLSRVYYKSEKNVFRYYYFINAKNESEFNDYVQNSKKASLYTIDATAKYGDQLLTLSTCDYSQKDGRLAVVAKKINK